MIPIASILAALGNRKTWITLAVIAGVILAGFAVTSYVATKSENMVIKQELVVQQKRNEQLVANIRANQVALKTRNDLVTALGQVETVERVKTVKALEANPDWANQPIPRDILDSLRK